MIGVSLYFCFSPQTVGIAAPNLPKSEPQIVRQYPIKHQFEVLENSLEIIKIQQGIIHLQNQMHARKTNQLHKK